VDVQFLLWALYLFSFAFWDVMVVLFPGLALSNFITYRDFIACAVMCMT